jgi:hypothetical protein
MTQTPMDDPIARIRRYTADPVLIDIDTIVRAGRRRRRSQFVGAASGLAVLVAAVVGVTLGVTPSGHGHAQLTLIPANAPDPARGLVAQHAVAGSIETLATTSSGWQAETYLDTTGDICEGWVDPATSVMQGACGAALARSGPTGVASAAPVTPLLIEPEVGVTTRSVDAFGLTGPNTSTVTVTNRGHQLKVLMSNLHTADGKRAFLVRYRFPHIADWVDTATATDTRGTVLGSTMFVAPDTGTPSGPLPTPTP